jgi:hypothetical protein
MRSSVDGTKGLLYCFEQLVEMQESGPVCLIALGSLMDRLDQVESDSGFHERIGSLKRKLAVYSFLASKEDVRDSSFEKQVFDEIREVGALIKSAIMCSELEPVAGSSGWQDPAWREEARERARARLAELQERRREEVELAVGPLTQAVVPDAVNKMEESPRRRREAYDKELKRRQKETARRGAYKSSNASCIEQSYSTKKDREISATQRRWEYDKLRRDGLGQSSLTSYQRSSHVRGHFQQDKQ